MKKTLLLLLAFVSVNAFAQLAVEGFEGNTWPPAGWAVVNVAGTQQTWQQSDLLNPIVPAFEGNYAAQIEGETITSGTTEDWLISPQFTVPANAQINFFSRLSAIGDQGTSYKVMMGTSPNQFDIGSYVVIEQWTETEINPSQLQYNPVNVIIPAAYVGQQAYIAFVMEGDGGESWLIDNVQLSNGCPAPYNLTATNITADSFTLGWTGGAETEWEIEIVPAGTSFTGNGIIATANPFTFTGLVGGNYNVCVRAICEDDSASMCSAPFVVSTMVCEPTEQCAYNFIMTDAGNNGWNGNTMTVSQNGIIVGTLSLQTGGQSSVSLPLCEGIPFELYWNNSGNFPQEVGITVNNAFGQPVFVHAAGASGQGNVLFTGPAECVADFCYAPYNLSSSVLATTATISWGGSSNNYQYYLVSEGAAAPDSSTVGISVNSNSEEIESLQTNTSYDVYVRAVCPDMVSGTIYSAWTGPHTFSVSTGNTITGTVMLDANGDNICNALDYNLPAFEIITSINDEEPFSIYTDMAGSFVLDTLNDGLNNITLQVLTPAGFDEVAPVMQQVTFGPGTNTSDISFCVAMPEEPVLDLSVNLIPVGVARPGFPAYYQLVVTNNGPLPLTALSTTVTFDDTRINLANASNPFTEADGVISLTLPALAPFGSNATNITFHVDTPPVNIGGEQLEFISTSAMATVTGVPVNGTSILSQTIVNSYDPNDITCHQGPSITEDQADDYLTYTIRFQNTGTADAVNIRLENILDNQFDWGTFRPLAASHDYFVTRREGQLEFRFDEIHLPAEQDDEQASQGYVTYRIKPVAAFGLGDIVSNTAGIYFDFNEPIITNTATTEVVATMGTEIFTNNSASLYPNPVSDKLNIVLQQGELTSVKIYDVNGREFNAAVAGNTVDTSGLSSGVYIVRVTTTNGMSVHKIIKN